MLKQGSQIKYKNYRNFLSTPIKKSKQDYKKNILKQIGIILIKNT